MVSEDSQDLGWLAMVHRLRDLRDLSDPRQRQMPAETNQLDDPYELLEVVSLRGPQRVPLEERDDDVPQVAVPLHAVPEEVLPVIVVTSVPVDASASEKSDELLQDAATRRSLNDGEFWSNLPSERRRAAAVDRTAETALAIYKTHNPSCSREPFLLVFRTARIVTA